MNVREYHDVAHKLATRRTKGTPEGDLKSEREKVMRIMGVDPGTTETGYVVIDEGYAILEAGKIPNEELIAIIKNDLPSPDYVALESIGSYGMAVGREVFQTCFFIGEVIRTCKDSGTPFTLYARQEYTRRICGVGKINDAVLRQALLLRFGGDRKGEPLHLLRGNSDKRSAFAVAVYHLDVLNSGGVR